MTRRLRAPKGFYRETEGGHCFPEYPGLAAPGLAKLRAKARKGGLAGLTKAERHAYGEAVETAIRALQAKALYRGKPLHNVECASGTNATTGAEIERAIRARHLAALHACPGRNAKLTPVQWEAAYEAAMAEKRARAKAADRFAIPEDGGIPAFLRRAA